MECGRKVIPVFYGVDRSHVRNQLGSFIEEIVSHLQHDDDVNKVQKWKEALADATDLEGWDSSSFRDDFELIEKIVKDVLRKLENHCLPKDVKRTTGNNWNLWDGKIGLNFGDLIS
ncbi:hypothetical protein PIB30_013469 [Stylosanthes scabra]|uniref:TIR domain-containing protein n=1 Tax=Stylosanthes scabra TaxID=79078 RepID=A0ABU6Z605_9FABA|nr:hypothetical protein [Stylosanthes scabra]